MARYKNEKMERFKENDRDIFKTGRLEFDLTDMRFLHAGVDTIRQQFKCSINPVVYDQLENHFEKTSSEFITLGGIEWKLKKSGKQSGYKYILKNLEEGLIVLYRSFYTEACERGDHLKIEVTPQLIYEMGLAKLSNRIREIGRIFGDTLEASGVAVHLAVDIKGLQIPDDFEEKLICHSKRSFKVSGISEMGIDAASMAIKYNKGETYLFGRANGLQMCLYEKSLEALKSDKLAFWESVWKRVPSLEKWPECEYDDGSQSGVPDTVHRLEFRVHQRIIREFENGNFNETGQAVCIREAVDLIGHLDNLLAYCLNNFRLQHSSTYIHPIWQKIAEDIRLIDMERWNDGFIYKRATKKSAEGPSRRNVGLWIGNFLTLACRRGLTDQECIDAIMTSGLIDDLHDYFGVLKYHESACELPYLVADFVHEKLKSRRLDGLGAAA